MSLCRSCSQPIYYYGNLAQYKGNICEVCSVEIEKEITELYEEDAHLRLSKDICLEEK